jgi:hypothetical protein
MITLSSSPAMKSEGWRILAPLRNGVSSQTIYVAIPVEPAAKASPLELVGVEVQIRFGQARRERFGHCADSLSLDFQRAPIACYPLTSSEWPITNIRSHFY